MPESSDYQDLTPVYTAAGQLAGQMICMLLQSMEIPAFLSQESAGLAFGFTVGPMGVVTILVPADRVADARAVLDDMEAGKFENQPDLDRDGVESDDPDNKVPPQDRYKPFAQ